MPRSPRRDVASLALASSLLFACGAGSRIPTDQSAPTDGGPPAPPADAGVDAFQWPSDNDPDASPVDTSIHSIDIGYVPEEALVHLLGVVIVAPVRPAGIDPETSKCLYEAYVQDSVDPTPSGIRVFSDGPTCAGTPCSCPDDPSTAGAAIAWLHGGGGAFDLTGGVETVKRDGGPTEHGVFVTKATPSSATPSMPPIVLGDEAIAQLGKDGPAWATYEGMLVTLRPTTPMTVATSANGAFTAANVRFSTDYLPAGADGGAFPAAGSTWSSITGVVRTAMGGSIAPRTMDDLVQ
jgi:hypothetical protein